MSSSDSLSRRQLLLGGLPIGAAGCVGCTGLALCAAQVEPQDRMLRSGEQAEMTWQEVFNFRYKRAFIPTMKKLAEQMGRERLVAMLQKAASDAASEAAAQDQRPASERDLAAFSASMKEPGPIYEHCLVRDIVEDTPRAFEVRISQCLWAKTFQEMDAADIGYATTCHPDFAVASAFNPKITLIRTQTLMQGHDACNHRWVMEG